MPSSTEITTRSNPNRMKIKSTLFLLCCLIGLLCQIQAAETIVPDLKALAEGRSWTLTPGFKSEAFEKDGKPAVKIFSDGTGKGGATARLDGVTFANGEIEVDILAATFIGVAFRVQDEKQMDLLYFRPQKFGKPKKEGDLDGEVQYSSEPKFGWSPLRKNFPMKYEKNLPNAPKSPNLCFHARIVVEGPKVRVYVDGATEPCLTVEESLSGRSAGGVGLWTWPGGMFANLKITSVSK